MVEKWHFFVSDLLLALLRTGYLFLSAVDADDGRTTRGASEELTGKAFYGLDGTPRGTAPLGRVMFLERSFLEYSWSRYLISCVYVYELFPLWLAGCHTLHCLASGWTCLISYEQNGGLQPSDKQWCSGTWSFEGLGNEGGVSLRRCGFALFWSCFVLERCVLLPCGCFSECLWSEEVHSYTLCPPESHKIHRCKPLLNIWLGSSSLSPPRTRARPPGCSHYLMDSCLGPLDSVLFGVKECGMYWDRTVREMKSWIMNCNIIKTNKRIHAGHYSNNHNGK